MRVLLSLISLLTGLFISQSILAEVEWRHLAEDNIFVKVNNDGWQPEGFENGISVPATHVLNAAIVLDGKDNEADWNNANEVFLPLAYGSVVEVSVKALYTDKEVFIRARWPDATENRQHHPWIWNTAENRYVSGPQVEDSILLSFEGGCEWAPSLLQGYVYDFDGWHWLAARSDPVGQAWDIDGTVQDQPFPGLNFVPYPSRKSGMDWNVKFVDRNDNSILHDDWDQLKRMYFYRRAGETVYIRAEPDRMKTTNPAIHMAPPAGPPVDANITFPQFEAVRLEGDAGEVSAKGHWEDGYWTVEFRRDLLTPADTSTDWVFVRLSQFSINVFDGVEHINQASESPRLFLRFLPPEQTLVKD
jgi:hypothetical protein